MATEANTVDTDSPLEVGCVGGLGVTHLVAVKVVTMEPTTLMGTNEVRS